MKAIGQRLSARACAVPVPDPGPREALSRLPAHQSRTLASAVAMAGGCSASASAIRARAASSVAATSPWLLLAGTLMAIQDRS